MNESFTEEELKDAIISGKSIGNLSLVDLVQTFKCIASEEELIDAYRKTDSEYVKGLIVMEIDESNGDCVDCHF